MRGDVVEIIEPLISIAFAVIITTVMGFTAYLLLDIMGKELSKQHPTLLSLQLAGITSAVASAPQDAVYCMEIKAPVEIAIKWQKNDKKGMSVVVTGVREATATSRSFKSSPFSEFHIGPMPQPYPIKFLLEIKKGREKVIAIQKKNEQLSVSEIDDIEECDYLV